MIKKDDYLLLKDCTIVQCKEVEEKQVLTDMGVVEYKDIIAYAKTREILMPNYEKQYIWLNGKYEQLERKYKRLLAKQKELEEENEELRRANIGMQERLGIKHE